MHSVLCPHTNALLPHAQDVSPCNGKILHLTMPTCQLLPPHYANLKPQEHSFPFSKYREWGS